MRYGASPPFRPCIVHLSPVGPPFLKHDKGRPAGAPGGGAGYGALPPFRPRPKLWGLSRFVGRGGGRWGTGLRALRPCQASFCGSVLWSHTSGACRQSLQRLLGGVVACANLRGPSVGGDTEAKDPPFAGRSGSIRCSHVPSGTTLPRKGFFSSFGKLRVVVVTADAILFERGSRPDDV